jgi:AraC family transcriptional regulator
MNAMTTFTQEMTVEAERATAIAQAQIVRLSWPEPFSAKLLNEDAHVLDFCLTPRPSGAIGRFAEFWPRTRYEQFGKVFLIPAGLEMEVRAGAGEQRALRVMFNPRTVCEWLDVEQDWSDRRLSASLDIHVPQIPVILRRLAQELENPGFAGDTMTELLNMQLAIEIARFLRSVPERASGGLAPWRLRLIDERIQQDGQAPTLQDLAGLVDLSVRQLTRGFRDSRGCSIGSYIEQKRIEAACCHLKRGMSVKQVSYVLGFASPSGFSHAFRMARGETPRTYRARERCGPPPLLS